jgi:hypothetical protein
MIEPRMIVRRLLPGLVALFLSTSAWAQTSAPSIQPHPPLPAGKRYYVKIDSIPQSAAVYLDSKSYGIVGYTPYVMQLPTGTYTVILDLQGFQEYTASINVLANAAYTYTLQHQSVPAVVDIEPGADGAASGADVLVDGVKVGTVPGTFTIDLAAASRHQVEVQKQGYQPFSQWVDLTEGEHTTLVVPLSSAAASAGALLVDADQAGAEVYVDGNDAGQTPAYVANLAVGPHQVEVKKGTADWKQAVQVAGGGTPQKVMATLGGGAGGLTVLSTPTGATVTVDGTQVGKTPYKTSDVPAGQHVIQATMDGYDPATQNITLDPAAPQVVNLTLQPSAAATQGTLSVISPVDDSEVYIDGSDAGKAPVQKQVSSGDHYVTVKKAGFADFKQKVTVTAGRTVQVTADLKDVGIVRVISNVDGAQVFLDGGVVGQTSSTQPLVLNDISSGGHVVAVRMSGYGDYKNENVTVSGGVVTIVDAELTQNPTGPTPEQAAAIQQGLSAFGAHVVPPGHFAASVGSGYPYYLFGRITTGTGNLPYGGLDVSLDFKSFFYLNTLGVSGKYEFIHGGPFSAAGFLDLGGGFGPNDRDSYFTNFGVLGSLFFSNRVTFTGRAYVEMWDDRLCANNDPQNPTRDQCKITDFTTGEGLRLTAAGIHSNSELLGRYTGARIGLSAILEVAVNEKYSVFALLDGPIAGKPRADYMKAINGPLLFAEDDPEVYFNLGVTFKF